MLTKKEIYLKAIKTLEKKRLEKKILLEKNLNIAFSKCPEIKILYNKINLTSLKLAKSLYLKNKNKNYIIEKIKDENISTQNQIKNLLIKNNLPEDFLEIKPFCEVCQDFGIVNNERCECFKKLIKTITSKELIKNTNFKNFNFENFNLKYYEKTSMENDEISPFAQMSIVYKTCKKYAENFPNDRHNSLLMYGLTGLGKTHLSIAIALKIIDKGYSALYETAAQIIRNFLNNNNSMLKDSNPEYGYISNFKETDLLILDDLGCEHQSSFNKSVIFEIINIRTSLNKPMIISTNLFPEEINKIYGQRISSRIFSTFTIIPFKGTDNRQKNYEHKKYS